MGFFRRRAAAVTTAPSDTLPPAALAPDAVRQLLPLVVRSGEAPEGLSEALRTPDFAISAALAVAKPPLPISLALIEHFRAQNLDFEWLPTAVCNLIGCSGLPYTHIKKTSDGHPMLLLMMHDDGFGSSRILLAPMLRKMFPDGYLLAVPTQECGAVVNKNLSEAEMKEARDTIASLFRRGDVPLSSRFYEPDEWEFVEWEFFETEEAAVLQH